MPLLGLDAGSPDKVKEVLYAGRAGRGDNARSRFPARAQELGTPLETIKIPIETLP